MRCSAIIVTYNSGATIARCLEALLAEDCEIIVVDNASADDSMRITQGFVDGGRVRLLANSVNRGFAAAVNQGAREASGEVLLILNPDAIAERGAIAALLACIDLFEANAAGGLLLADNGEPARGFTFRTLPSPTALAFEALLVNRIWPSNPVNRRNRSLDADYSRAQQVEQPAGACLALSRETWQKLQGFDEQFFPVWFEDVDFCKRLRDDGRKIVYCPEARFRHSGAHSVGRLSFHDKQVFWYANMMRYARKHFSPGQVFLLRCAIAGGMVLRSIAAVFGIRQASLQQSLSAYRAVLRTL